MGLPARAKTDSMEMPPYALVRIRVRQARFESPRAVSVDGEEWPCMSLSETTEAGGRSMRSLQTRMATEAAWPLAVTGAGGKGE